MKTILVNMFLFFYIYPIPFIFLPVSTRILLAILGFILFVVSIVQQKKDLRLEKYFFRFLLLLFSIGFIALFSIGFNGSPDIEFVKYVVSMIAIIFASYFIVKCLKKLKYELNFQTISGLIVNVILIQSVIGFMMFLIPELRDILLSIQRFRPDEIERMRAFFEFRILGFGAMYFGAGIISGFGLILIGALIRLYSFSTKQIILLSLKFLIILVVGMMMARTTMIGGLLGMLLIFMPKNLHVTISILKKRALFIFSIITIPSIVIIILFYAIPRFSEVLEPAFNFAFELFINYSEKGSLESDSTNALLKSYRFPSEIKTYIIGDAYFAHPTEIGKYYANTDVGYIRLISYFGIIGLLAYFTMQIYLIIRAYKNFGVSSEIYLFIVAYLLILNLKGFSDLLFLNILFMIAHLLNKNYKIKEI